MSGSYGYAYLTSYGWSGSGTGLRIGAIDKPLAIPPKKNLSGLGKDRDDAFPFWDHLFSAASKAITIKVSTDDEDVDTENPSSPTDLEVVPLRRTTTGILSSRRPVLGTPVSTSGSTTPNPIIETDTPGRLSLLATAKREAAKRGLYSMFFRGPVLGPDDDPRVDPRSHLVPLLSEVSSISTPTLGRADESEDKAATKEERRERKRLKRERKAVRAVKKSEKEKARQRKDRQDDADQKVQQSRQDKESRSEGSQTSPYWKKGRRRTQISVLGLERKEGDLETTKRTQKEGDLALLNDGRQCASHRSSSDLTLAARRKRKRRDTPS